MCESTPAILTMRSLTTGLIGRLSTIFQDFDNQLSWGRICACVALIVAVVEQFRHADVAHVSLWLGAAMGHYSVSKITEMVSGGTQ
jgi:hypothetical protein